MVERSVYRQNAVLAGFQKSEIMFSRDGAISIPFLNITTLTSSSQSKELFTGYCLPKIT